MPPLFSGACPRNIGDPTGTGVRHVARMMVGTLVVGEDVVHEYTGGGDAHGLRRPRHVPYYRSDRGVADVSRIVAQNGRIGDLARGPKTRRFRLSACKRRKEAGDSQGPCRKGSRSKLVDVAFSEFGQKSSKSSSFGGCAGMRLCCIMYLAGGASRRHVTELQHRGKQIVTQQG
jgi:hypothetical protein